MKRILAVLGLLIVAAAGGLAAQTRVSVSFGFGAPFVAYHPRPYGYGYRYGYGYVHRYDDYGYRRYGVYGTGPTIVVLRGYRPARVFVERGHRRHRYHRW